MELANQAATGVEYRHVGVAGLRQLEVQSGPRPERIGSGPQRAGSDVQSTIPDAHDTLVDARDIRLHAIAHGLKPSAEVDETLVDREVVHDPVPSHPEVVESVRVPIPMEESCPRHSSELRHSIAGLAAGSGEVPPHVDRTPA